MLELLLSNFVSVLIIVGFIVFALALIFTGQWLQLRSCAYALMLTAERIYVDFNGEEKFNVVFDKFYCKYMPKWLKLFLTADIIKAILQNWYNKAKNYMKAG